MRGTTAAMPSTVEKIETQLGYRAAVTLEAGLRETFAWYLANTSWWQAVMDGSYRNWIQTNYAG